MDRYLYSARSEARADAVSVADVFNLSGDLA